MNQIYYQNMITHTTTIIEKRLSIVTARCNQILFKVSYDKVSYSISPRKQFEEVSKDFESHGKE